DRDQVEHPEGVNRRDTARQVPLDDGRLVPLRAEERQAALRRAAHRAASSLSSNLFNVALMADSATSTLAAPSTPWSASAAAREMASAACFTSASWFVMAVVRSFMFNLSLWWCPVAAPIMAPRWHALARRPTAAPSQSTPGRTASHARQP